MLYCFCLGVVCVDCLCVVFYCCVYYLFMVSRLCRCCGLMGLVRWVLKLCCSDCVMLVLLL